MAGDDEGGIRVPSEAQDAVGDPADGSEDGRRGAGGAPRRMGRRRTLRRRLVGILIGLVVAFVVVALVGLPLYAFPAVDEPQRADAVIVLGPPHGAGIRTGEELMAAGYADTLAVSVDAYGIDSGIALDACHEDRPYRVVCVHPDPFTTEGEAQWVRRLADANGWTSVIVVTYPYHVTRARYLFDRCGVPGAMFVSNGDDPGLARLARMYVYQSAAFVKAWIDPGC